MPFKVRKRDDYWVVVNEDTGRVLGKHTTKTMALRQLHAVYANYKPKHKKGHSK